MTTHNPVQRAIWEAWDRQGFTEPQTQAEVMKWALGPLVKDPSGNGWIRLSGGAIETYPALDVIFHPVNEGKRGPLAAMEAKRGGMKKGVMDICLPVRTPWALGGWTGLWLELKVGKNKPEPEQIVFGKRMLEEGWAVRVTYGLTQTIDALTEYLEGRWQGKNTGHPELVGTERVPLSLQ